MQTLIWLALTVSNVMCSIVPLNINTSDENRVNIKPSASHTKLPKELQWTSSTYEKAFKLLEKELCEVKNVVLTKICTPLETNYYYFSASNEKKTWSESHAYCKTIGMNLAMFESVAENNAVLAAADVLLCEEKHEFFWIDASDAVNEGTFMWITDAVDLPLFWAKNYGFHPNEPTSNIHNSDGANEDCVDVIKREKCTRWEDRFCGDKGRFICRLSNVCRDVYNFKAKHDC